MGFTAHTQPGWPPLPSGRGHRSAPGSRGRSLPFSERQRILVVDAEIEARAAAADALFRAGLAHDLASGLAGAVRLAGSRRYTLMLCGVDPGEGAGLALLERLRALQPRALLLASGAANLGPGELEALAQRGADMFLPKPFRGEWLQELIEASLWQRHERVLREGPALALEHALRPASPTGDDDPAGSPATEPDDWRSADPVSEWSALVAGLIGWSEERVNRLWVAAGMRDVGMLDVPRPLREPSRGRPSPATPAERAEALEHTRHGAEMLAGEASPLFVLGRSLAATHHERFDGEGGPVGLKGAEIPEETRVLAVAEVLAEHLASPAVDEPEALHAAAGALRREAGRRVDPRIALRAAEELEDWARRRRP